MAIQEEWIHIPHARLFFLLSKDLLEVIFVCAVVKTENFVDSKVHLPPTRGMDSMTVGRGIRNRVTNQKFFCLMSLGQKKQCYQSHNGTGFLLETFFFLLLSSSFFFFLSTRIDHILATRSWVSCFFLFLLHSSSFFFFLLLRFFFYLRNGLDREFFSCVIFCQS